MTSKRMNKYYFISVRSESTRLNQKALLKINYLMSFIYLKAQKIYQN